MLAALVALVLSLPAQIGEPAPPITAETWLDGDAPELKGQPVLLEFWGTWCGPCVAAMPHVQDLWTRYREQGLRVVAISYETPEVMRPFLEQHGYTMPVGSDPRKSCIEAFGVTSWPTTFVIDRQGVILFRGNPAGSEAFVQQALGLETSPATLLTRYVDGSGDAREMLEQLTRNASHAFPLGAWAEGKGGSEGPRPPKDPGEALSNLASLWSTPMRAAPLNDLASLQEPFDLKTWARRELGALFPIGDEELAALLEAGSYADMLEAVVSRNPSDKALGKAKSDDGWRDWCNERAAKYRENAEVVLMYGYWFFGEWQPPDSYPLPPATGVMTRKGPKGDVMSGVILNTGEALPEESFPACIGEYLARTAAVSSFAKRKVPDLPKAADKLHDELLADLKKKHGTKKKPKPDS